MPTTTVVTVTHNGTKYDITVSPQFQKRQFMGYLLTQGKDQISVTIDAIPTLIAALTKVDV